MRVDGRAAPARRARSARSRAGIETVHQQSTPGSCPATGRPRTSPSTGWQRGGRARCPPRAGRARARGRSRTGAGLDLPLDALVDRLGVQRPPADRARARARARPRLLILDEPTSALSARETERLFATSAGCASSGVAILYVSHRLAEVAGLADRVAVLRDGRLVADFCAPLSAREIVEAMLGRARRASRAAARAPTGDPRRRAPALDGRRGARRPRVRPGPRPPFDLELRGGEVLGADRPIGAGKSALLDALFGVRPLAAGDAARRQALAARAPAEAIARGVYLVPEDRAAQACCPSWSVRANLTLPFLRLRPARFLDRARRARRADGAIADLGVVAAGRRRRSSSLSGGNQQKVVVGRWLRADGAAAAARRAVPRRRPRRAGRHRPPARASGRGRGDARRLAPTSTSCSRSPTGSWCSTTARSCTTARSRRRPRGASCTSRPGGVDPVGAAPGRAPSGASGCSRCSLGLIVFFALDPAGVPSVNNIFSILHVGLDRRDHRLGVTRLGSSAASTSRSAPTPGFTVMLCAIGLVLFRLDAPSRPIALAGGLLIGALNGLLVVRLGPGPARDAGDAVRAPGAAARRRRGQSISTGVVLRRMRSTGVFTRFLCIGRGSWVPCPVP